MLFAEMTALLGPVNEYVREFAGMSESVAVLVTTSVVSAVIERLACSGKIGALFTSLTVTTKLFVSLNGGTPLSVTTVVNVFALGPWASVGVQLMIPLPLIVAPVGAASR